MLLRFALYLVLFVIAFPISFLIHEGSCMVGLDHHMPGAMFEEIPYVVTTYVLLFVYFLVASLERVIQEGGVNVRPWSVVLWGSFACAIYGFLGLSSYSPLTFSRQHLQRVLLSLLYFGLFLGIELLISLLESRRRRANTESTKRDTRSAEEPNSADSGP